MPSWKQVIEEIGPRAHIEAAGAFALAYNKLEWSLYGLLGLVLKDDDDVVVFMFNELNNTQKMNLIRHMVDRSFSADSRHHIEYGLRCFSICAENRNIIMHASPDRSPDSRHLNVVKGVKGRPGAVNEYAFTLSDLRDAAKSALMLSDYIYALVDVIGDMLMGARLGLSWPQKPPQPRKLSSSLRPEIPEDAPPPLQPPPL